VAEVGIKASGTESVPVESEGPDLGGLIQAGSLAQKSEVVQEISEPETAEGILPAEPAESEEMWCARMRGLAVLTGGVSRREFYTLVKRANLFRA